MRTTRSSATKLEAGGREGGRAPREPTPDSTGANAQVVRVRQLAPLLVLLVVRLELSHANNLGEPGNGCSRELLLKLGRRVMRKDAALYAVLWSKKRVW